MQDMASHSSPQPDSGELRHTLSVSDVGAALTAAGVPRSQRSIVRYCETAMLDAVKVPGPTGPQWYVSPASLPKAIGDLKQWEEQRARQSPSKLDMADPVAVEVAPNSNTATASHGAPQPAVADKEISQNESETQPDTARYVALLERDNDFLREQVTKKDEQITDLSKRFGETQTLLGAMQRMFAPFLGQADPFNAPEKREVDPPAA